MKYTITPFSDALYLIGLEPPITGFENFISAWLYKGNPTFLVDVGPKVTSGLLIKALNELEIDTLDAIFLTHIHIDHAGGLSEIAGRFEGVPIICHEKGIPHMIDPERLYKGSVKTLGKTAEIYGPINPVSEKRLIAAQHLDLPGIQAAITPGHAPHHVSYLKDGYLFAGEAGGVCLSFDDGSFYLRPATPPRFFLETHVQSIEKLIDFSPDIICYGHFGLQENATALLQKNREQLFLWHDIIKNHIKTQPDDPERYQKLTHALIEKDPCLDGFFKFNKAIQERERTFIKNAILGFEGYLNGN